MVPDYCAIPGGELYLRRIRHLCSCFFGSSESVERVTGPFCRFEGMEVFTALFFSDSFPVF